MNYIRLEQERARLTGERMPERAPGLGVVWFDVVTGELPPEVTLERARMVLLDLNRYGAESWPQPDEWAVLLPDWFVAACAAAKTPQEAQAWLARWRRLTDDERRLEEASKRWSLPDWLYWMEPERRAWWWWDATDRPTPKVAVQVDEWPFPWGALSWLLRASGAESVAPSA